METWKKAWIAIGIVCAVLLLAAVTPMGRSVWNRWFFNVQKADDVTNYETIKKVEDTCRSMMASYESDKMVYEQYKNSESAEERSWASQAMMRANKTAATYNEYVLKNSFVWEDNIPNDAKNELDFLE